MCVCVCVCVYLKVPVSRQPVLRHGHNTYKTMK